MSELVRLTHDEHAEVRSQAVNTLSYLEPSDRVALDDFIRLLDDPDPVVVETALDGLQRLAPNAKAISAIARLLKSPDDMVREAAIRTLVGIGHEAKSAIPALSKLLQDADGLPPEYTCVDLPAGRYAVFTHSDHVSSLPKTIDTIWSQWVPDSGLKIGSTPSFELYTEEFDPATGRGGMEVWVPIGQ